MLIMLIVAIAHDGTSPEIDERSAVRDALGERSRQQTRKFHATTQPLGQYVPLSDEALWS